MLRAPALPAGLPAYPRQQVHPVGAKVFVQELVHVRVAGVAGQVAAVARDLAETVEIQLSDEARDVARLEDRPARVQILSLEPLVIKQYGAAIRAPPDRPGPALVHYPPELLRESHRLQHTVLVHSRAGNRLGIGSAARERVNDAFRTFPVPSVSCLVPPSGETFETNDCRITATIIKADLLRQTEGRFIFRPREPILYVQICVSCPTRFPYLFPFLTFLRHSVRSVPTRNLSYVHRDWRLLTVDCSFIEL